MLLGNEEIDLSTIVCEIYNRTRKILHLGLYNGKTKNLFPVEVSEYEIVRNYLERKWNIQKMAASAVSIQDYVEWLNGCETVSDVKPITVIIGGQIYEGVRYFLNFRGKDGENIGFLGVKPKSFQGKVLFHHEDTNIDWYLSGYIDEVKPEYAHAHPKGSPWWCISPWNFAEPIDAHERKKYKRLSLEIQDA